MFTPRERRVVFYQPGGGTVSSERGETQAAKEKPPAEKRGGLFAKEVLRGAGSRALKPGGVTNPKLSSSAGRAERASVSVTSPTALSLNGVCWWMRGSGGRRMQSTRKGELLLGQV